MSMGMLRAVFWLAVMAVMIPSTPRAGATSPAPLSIAHLQDEALAGVARVKLDLHAAMEARETAQAP